VHQTLHRYHDDAVMRGPCVSVDSRTQMPILDKLISVSRRICGFSLRARWRNEDIKAWLGIKCDVVDVMRRRRLPYFGHIIRMKLDRIPAREVQGRIHVSRSRIGSTQKTVHKETCHSHSFIQSCSLAMNRHEWRKVVFGSPKRSTESQRHKVK